MKRRIMLLLVVLVFVVSGYFLWNSFRPKPQYHANERNQGSFSTPQTTQVSQKAEEEAVAKEMNKTLQDGKFNGSALVVKDGKILLNKGYGYANFKNQTPNNPNTKFWIGSITKSSVAVAILQLQEEGKLNIHDNVNKYIPFFPASKHIELYHLLTHTSGLPDKGAKGRIVATHASYVDWIGKQPLASIPGTAWRYSDYNYVVLAYIVESITKEPLAQYIQTHIFEPAGMTAAGIGKTYYQQPDQSRGYRMKGIELQDVSGLNFPSLFGCGDIYMTTEDMYKFDRALMNGALISQDSLRQLMTPGSKSTYGFGFYISPDQSMHNHGVVGGWDALNVFDWNQKNFVILFSNVYNKDIGNLNSQLMKLATSSNL